MQSYQMMADSNMSHKAVQFVCLLLCVVTVSQGQQGEGLYTVYMACAAL